MHWNRKRIWNLSQHAVKTISNKETCRIKRKGAFFTHLYKGWFQHKHYGFFHKHYTCHSSSILLIRIMGYFHLFFFPTFFRFYVLIKQICMAIATNIFFFYQVAQYKIADFLINLTYLSFCFNNIFKYTIFCMYLL